MRLLPASLGLNDDPASDGNVERVRGGRAAALNWLARVQPEPYARSRNFLAGDVTRLSAYLRHGVLTLAEVRDFALGSVREPAAAGKLVNELGWRDYWQRLYAELGEGVWSDRESYKTGFTAKKYAEQLPEDISGGTTTLVCMDSFARDLALTGYLHNHARMWTAAYVVHWRRIRWQAGARWFLRHLLDGDPASNNLSWQWVASTFASAPYMFNRENLQRYTDDAYCSKCPHAKAGTCPFEGDYDGLQQTLFPQIGAEVNADPMPTVRFAEKREAEPESAGGGRALVWHHTDSLNPDAAALKTHAGDAAVFVWDVGWLQQAAISKKRVMFLAECLDEMPGEVELRAGDVAEELLAVVRASGATHVVAQRTVDPRLLQAAATVQKTVPVVWWEVPPFVEGKGFDLKRFSRYWKKAQWSAMERTRADR